MTSYTENLTAKVLLQVLPKSQTTIYRYLRQARESFELKKHQHLPANRFSIWLYGYENKEFLKKVEEVTPKAIT